MTPIFITIIFIAIALLHLYPALGVLSGARLQALYGVPLDDPNLLILMRHRAVLFGVLGGFLLVAAFWPRWQPAAFVAGFISMLSFIVIFLLEGNSNALLRKVFVADILGCGLLACGAVLFLIGQK